MELTSNGKACQLTNHINKCKLELQKKKKRTATSVIEVPQGGCKRFPEKVVPKSRCEG